MFIKALAIAAAVGGVVAQRPSNVSICDYYTIALLKNNTAANQMTLLTLVVNTAVIGNYTKPNVGITVPGILAPGMYNGTAVNLAPYFTGALASTNGGGMMGISVNFLDGGGAAPLMMNMPANSTTSNQYRLLTHLYEYFGVLLGCSMQGASDYPAYTGSGSMYKVHKFMDLSYAEVGWFIQQVASSAASFGVAQSDLEVVGMALANLFDYRCAPPTVVVPSQGAQLQSICTDSTCPIALNSSCNAVANVTQPMPASVSGSMPSGPGTAPSSTSISPIEPTDAAGAAGVAGVSLIAAVGGLIAALL
ncbi:MAG: hypothetical protein M1818_000084 [Claussenomyces sp. TS43310]|nr:MAG: hypothetical protein M1818_000084 [Claussenomyces sp. TS43310]